LRRHRADRIEAQLRRLAADQLSPRVCEDGDLAPVAGNDIDIHQLRQLIDVGVAVVEQRSGCRVSGGRCGNLLVERGDLPHRLVGFVHRIGNREFGVRALRLDTAAQLIELLGEKLRAVDDARARTWIVWAGRKDLQCGRENCCRQPSRDVSSPAVRRSPEAASTFVPRVGIGRA
jgi:hypothetical protein